MRPTVPTRTNSFRFRLLSERRRVSVMIGTRQIAQTLVLRLCHRFSLLLQLVECWKYPMHENGSQSIDFRNEDLYENRSTTVHLYATWRDSPGHRLVYVPHAHSTQRSLDDGLISRETRLQLRHQCFSLAVTEQLFKSPRRQT